MTIGDIGAVAPNAGAHALLAWLGDDDQLNRLAEMTRAGISDETVDRLVAGTLLPGDELAATIARASEGEVLPDHWDIAPGPAWDAAPIAFDPRF